MAPAPRGCCSWREETDEIVTDFPFLPPPFSEWPCFFDVLRGGLDVGHVPAPIWIFPVPNQCPETPLAAAVHLALFLGRRACTRGSFLRIDDHFAGKKTNKQYHQGNNQHYRTTVNNEKKTRRDWFVPAYILDRRSTGKLDHETQRFNAERILALVSFLVGLCGDKSYTAASSTLRNQQKRHERFFQKQA
jgi:hypothetical protein